MPPVTTVLPATTTIPVQQLPRTVETSQNLTALTKAKDDKNRAERVVKEQEKIIKKLEDLLERSMHTVDKRNYLMSHYESLRLLVIDLQGINRKLTNYIT